MRLFSLKFLKGRGSITQHPLLNGSRTIFEKQPNKDSNKNEMTKLKGSAYLYIAPPSSILVLDGKCFVFPRMFVQEKH